MSEEAALSADGFGRRYGRRGPWAVRGLSVAIPKGSITALVGPNGAGKSTLIRTWMGFERPDEGTVRIQGIDPQARRAEAVASIAYVPQGTALYAAWTIDDHFRMVESYRPQFDHEIAVRRVRGLGLDPARRVSQLSGGERAQVALTIALAIGAPILLLDEPMANLDPLARRAFLGTLKEGAQGSGATVVLTSHVVADVEEVCDALMILSHGRLLLWASVDAARARHTTVPAGNLEGIEPVSTFAGPTGERLALVRAAPARGKEATLEEVVLGYLASTTVSSAASDH